VLARACIVRKRVPKIAATLRRRVLRNPGFGRIVVLERPKVVHDTVASNDFDNVELGRVRTRQSETHCHDRSSVQYNAQTR
jgi:hypothetical protein